MIEHVLALARRGFPIFPVTPGQKDPPLYTGWQHSATTNEEVLRGIWKATPLANPGILTTDFLVVDVDVDEAKGENGFRTLLTLPEDIPDTYTQRTPRGGAHIMLSAPGLHLPNRVKFLPGLDTRAHGGYIVGAGAVLANGAKYTGNSSGIAPAPAWLVELVKRKVTAAPRAAVPGLVVDEDAATAQARRLLASLPIAPGGQRNGLAYQAACAVKDLGLSQAQTFDVMREGFQFERTGEAFTLEELRRTVQSAYERGQNAPGSTAPEADFAPVATPPADNDSDGASSAPGSPVDAAVADFNNRYAYALAGSSGNILHFTTDAFGRETTLFLNHDTFTKFNASKLVRFPGAQKPKPLTEVWMSATDRRTYRGVVFAPEQPIPPDFFNLWRGFAVKPLPAGEAAHDEYTPAMDDAMARFIEHAQVNICQNDAAQYKYLISYFAHAVQRPWEKPQVALAFRGDKGSGKDTLVDTFGALLGPHYINTPKRRQVIGDFNSALESCLGLNLNEAFFHADKSVHSIMNDLITGRKHLIERKGQEPYFVANLLRVFFIGNDDTVVHASPDERRYQCFEVGNGRRGQPRFFQKLRENMEAGGYRALLRFLLDWNLDGFNANEATGSSAMLHEQKLDGVNPFHRWWRESLEEGRLLRHDLVATWPDRIDKEALRTAFRQYRKDSGIGGWEMQNIWIGRRLCEACPSTDTKQKRGAVNEYRFPSLAVARQEWDKFIGYPGSWA